MRVLIGYVIILLAEELLLLLDLWLTIILWIGMRESHLRRAVEENLLRDCRHRVSQLPQLVIAMSKAA